MKRASVVAAVVFLVAGGALAAESPAPALPSDVLAVVEWPSPAGLEAHLQAYVNSFLPGRPVPPLAAGFVKLTKCTNPDALDPGRPLRVLVLKTSGAKVAPVILFGVTDLDAYLNNLMPALKKGEQDGKVTVFAEEKKKFDRKAFTRATPEEKKDFQKFLKVIRKTVAIGVEGTTVCVGQDKAPVAQAIGLVANGAITDQPLLPGGDLAVHVKAQDLLAHLAAAGGRPLDLVREKLRAFDPPRGPGGPQPAQIKAIWLAYIDAAETLAMQVKEAHGRLTIGPDQARCSFEIEAVPNSDVARYLASVPQGEPETLKYVPKDAFFVIAGKMGDMKPMAAWAGGFQQQILSAVGAPPALLENFIKMTPEIMGSYGDDFASALLPGGFRFMRIIRMKNPEAVGEITQRMISVQDGLTDMYKQMGLSMVWQVTPVALTYKGREISEWRLTFDFEPDPGADPTAARIKARQKQVLKGLFGQALRIHSTVLENDWVMACGDSVALVKRAIDGGYEHVGRSPAFQQTLATFPPKAQGLFYLDVADLTVWGVSLIHAITGGQMPIPLPQSQSQRGPGVAGVLVISGSRATCEIAVPAAAIQRAVAGFRPGAGPRPVVPQGQ